MNIQYQGWTITYSGGRPITGRWVAERFGVSLCAADLAALKRMIDQKTKDTAKKAQA